MEFLICIPTNSLYKFYGRHGRALSTFRTIRSLDTQYFRQETILITALEMAHHLLRSIKRPPNE